MRSFLSRLLERSNTDPLALVVFAAVVWVLGAVGLLAVVLVCAAVWAWMPWSLGLMVAGAALWGFLRD